MGADVGNGWEQDGLDLGIAAPTPPRERKVRPGKPYLRQVKLANPPMCTACVAEREVMRRDRQVIRTPPKRVSHVGWVPGMGEPLNMCVEHAEAFRSLHDLSRVKGRKGKG